MAEHHRQGAIIPCILMLARRICCVRLGSGLVKGVLLGSSPGTWVTVESQPSISPSLVNPLFIGVASSFLGCHSLGGWSLCLSNCIFHTWFPKCLCGNKSHKEGKPCVDGVFLGWSLATRPPFFDIFVCLWYWGLDLGPPHVRQAFCL